MPELLGQENGGSSSAPDLHHARTQVQSRPSSGVPSVLGSPLQPAGTFAIVQPLPGRKHISERRPASHTQMCWESHAQLSALQRRVDRKDARIWTIDRLLENFCPPEGKSKGWARGVSYAFTAPLGPMEENVHPTVRMSRGVSSANITRRLAESQVGEEMGGRCQSGVLPAGVLRGGWCGSQPQALVGPRRADPGPLSGINSSREAMAPRRGEIIVDLRPPRKEMPTAPGSEVVGGLPTRGHVPSHHMRP